MRFLILGRSVGKGKKTQLKLEKESGARSVGRRLTEKKKGLASLFLSMSVRKAMLDA